MIYGKEWFKKHQSKLLWLANTPLIKIWFRWILRIRKFDLPLSEKITEIMPNSFSWGDRIILEDREQKLIRTTDFRTHEKFGKRLYYAFRYIWMICHAWDIIVNWLRLPVLDLGFAELTFYPDAGDPASTAADAHFDKDAGSWAGARDAASSDAVSQVNATMQILSDDRGGGNYSIGRGITLFPTSSIPDGATILSAVLSLFENLGFSISDTDTTSLEITETSPASNTHLITSDYGTYTFVSLASINFSAITISDYNAFTLNDLSVVNKTGITKLGQITGRDLSDTAPTGNNRIYFYQSDETGTSRDPKLVVVTATIEKNLTDTVSISEVLSKFTSKIFSETVSISEVFTKVRAYMKTLIDTITPSDTIIRTINKTFSDTISLSEAIMKTIMKTITDTITITESLIKRTSQIFSDIVSVSDVLVRYKNGFKIIWNKIAKSASSVWSKVSKNTSIWTNKDKS